MSGMPGGYDDDDMASRYVMYRVHWLGSYMKSESLRRRQGFGCWYGAVVYEGRCGCDRRGGDRASIQSTPDVLSLLFLPTNCIECASRLYNISFLQNN